MTQEKIKSLCISPTLSVKDALERLSKTAERILFVIDHSDHLLGTITDGDIRLSLLNNFSMERRVDEVMETHFISLFADHWNIRDDAKALMREKKVLHIPIIDDAKRIVDIVAWHDLMNGSEISTAPTAPLKSTPVVIMAGGRGSRLRPFTHILPKALMPIGDKPIIESIMERFANQGFHRFILILHYKGEYIQAFLHERKLPFTIECVSEEKPLGTAGGVRLLANTLEEPFILANCDTLINVDYDDVVRFHIRQNALMTVVGAYHQSKLPFGVLTEKAGRLIHMEEKPTSTSIVNTGIYVINPEVVSQIILNEALSMSALIERIAHFDRTCVYTIGAHAWKDIGMREAYAEFLEHTPSL